MRILHTSDWHLGKSLETKTRYEEQQHFIDEISDIIERKNIDVVILSGDVFDTSNPPAAAEAMFFNSIVRLAKDRTVPVVVIAGNHDSPDRLLAGAGILRPYGVFIFGKPGDIVPEMKFDTYSISTDENGAVLIEKNGEKAVIAALPYVSDKRIDEIIGRSDDEAENALSYSEKIKELLGKLSKGFSDDTVNVVTAHLYTDGGKESGSERSIQLGGSYAVAADAFPEKSQYIALGHLHRPQTVPGLNKTAYYSGSPLEYSKDEAHYAKAVNIVDIKAGEKASVEKIMLSCIKPIEVFKCGSIEEAMEVCKNESGKNSYIYLEIKTDRPLTMDEIRQIKSMKEDIMDIQAVLEGRETAPVYERETMSLRDSFIDFYKKNKSAEPADDLTELFLSIMGEADNV